MEADGWRELFLVLCRDSSSMNEDTGGGPAMVQVMLRDGVVGRSLFLLPFALCYQGFDFLRYLMIRQVTTKLSPTSALAATLRRLSHPIINAIKPQSPNIVLITQAKHINNPPTAPTYRLIFELQKPPTQGKLQDDTLGDSHNLPFT